MHVRRRGQARRGRAGEPPPLIRSAQRYLGAMGTAFEGEAAVELLCVLASPRDAGEASELCSGQADRDVLTRRNQTAATGAPGLGARARALSRPRAALAAKKV